MKPKGGPKVRQIERSGRSYGGQQIGLAKIQRQVSQQEKAHILFQTLGAVFVVLQLKTALPRQSHQISFAFQHEKDAGQQLCPNRFFGQPFRPFLREQYAEVG